MSHKNKNKLYWDWICMSNELQKAIEALETIKNNLNLSGDYLHDVKTINELARFAEVNIDLLKKSIKKEENHFL